MVVLLWAWAATMFLVVDLFRNVEHFDGIRPRARLYRAMRYVAHDMVGEPNLDPEFAATSAVVRACGARTTLLRALASVSDLDVGQLARLVSGSADARIRIHAMRRLASVDESDARSVLVSVASDHNESGKIRNAAAEALGPLGDRAMADLDRLALDPDTAGGACRGISAVGTELAVRRLAAMTTTSASPLRRAALMSVARVRNPESARILAEIARNCSDQELAAASCEALGHVGGDAQRPVLCALATDRCRSREERAAALEALGRIGAAEDVGAVETIRHDESTQVARAAELAAHRIRHRITAK